MLFQLNQKPYSLHNAFEQHKNVKLSLIVLPINSIPLIRPDCQKSVYFEIHRKRLLFKTNLIVKFSLFIYIVFYLLFKDDLNIRRSMETSGTHINHIRVSTRLFLHNTNS